jgi:intracellular sulfur oxidation DsrE/DsrF family protein
MQNAHIAATVVAMDRQSPTRGRIMKRRILAAVVALGLLGGFGSVAADSPKVVLQITDDSVAKQVLVLNVADNLREHYGADLVLEIVAFGPGLNLMLSGNANSARLQSLAKKGIALSACRNTAHKMSKMLGEDVVLQDGVKYTEGGAARIVELVRQGYILVRP